MKTEHCSRGVGIVLLIDTDVVLNQLHLGVVGKRFERCFIWQVLKSEKVFYCMEQFTE